MVPPLQRRRTGGGPAMAEVAAEAIAAIPVSTFSPEGAGVWPITEGEAAVVEGSTTPTTEGPSSAAPRRAFLTRTLGDILGKVERAVKPLLKDLSRVRSDRAELRKTLDVKTGVIEKGRETIKVLESERQGLLNDRESLLKERDLAVMKLSLLEKELEELRQRAECCETRANSAEVAVMRANHERIHAEGELAALRNSHGVLEKNHEELKEALVAARESSRSWLPRYQELKEGEQINYHGAWNNTILQIQRDNPGVVLDLSKLNRYDDWVAYTNRDPFEGREEEWDRERLVPEEPDAEGDVGGTEAAQGGGSEAGGEDGGLERIRALEDLGDPSPPLDADDPYPPPDAENPTDPVDMTSAGEGAAAA